MKKQYIKPQREVVKIPAMQILAGSGFGGKLNAPAYEWDDELDDEG